MKPMPDFWEISKGLSNLLAAINTTTKKGLVIVPAMQSPVGFSTFAIYTNL
jgi:hypothetical protein